MFVKTRIPKDTNCVRFHGSNAKDAYHLASLFLGGKGRIANALDVMEARIKYGFKHPIWGCYITTASTEWFGLNRDGKPFIAVLHNPGPLFDEKIISNYISRQNVRHKLNVVAREIFLDIFAGKYGKVSLIPLQDAMFMANENKHNYAYLNKEQIEKDDLVRARLAHDYDYIQTHFEESIKENLENCHNQPGNINTSFLKCNCSDYAPYFMGLDKSPQRNYVQDFSRSPINLETEAVGHFICFGGLMNVNSNAVVSEVDLSTIQNDCAFLAVTDEENPIRLGNKVCMYSSGNYLSKLPNLFVKDTRQGELTEPDFFEINQIKGWYFTQRLRQQVAVSDKQKELFLNSDPTYSIKGEPEFLVKSLKPLGRRTIKVPVTDSFYTTEQIKNAFKNSAANAFQIVDGFNFRGKNYLAVVEYYKAEIYFDRMIPTEMEILQDYKLLGRMI